MEGVGEKEAKYQRRWAKHQTVRRRHRVGKRKNWSGPPWPQRARRPLFLARRRWLDCPPHLSPLITCLLGNATQCTNLGDTLSCVHCKKEKKKKKSSSRLEKTGTVHANLVYIDDDDAWCINVFYSERKRSGNRGYRCNRFEPVPGPTGWKPVQIQNSNLN